MKWWRFLFWNAAGGIAWAAAVGLTAYYGGKPPPTRSSATGCTPPPLSWWRRLPAGSAFATPADGSNADSDAGSAEREDVGGDSSCLERDRERVLVERIGLADQLVHARLRDHTSPVLVAVDTVGRARRLTVDQDTKRDVALPGSQHEVDVASAEAVRDRARAFVEDGRILPDRPRAVERPVVEAKGRRHDVPVRCRGIAVALATNRSPRALPR